MKKISLVILISVITLTIGCKKSEVTTPKLIGNNSLVGLWELRREIGVQVAGAPGVFASGNGRLLQFSDRNYKQLDAGIIVKSGTYLLAKESSWTDSDDRLVFDTDKDLKRFITVQNNNLTIYMAAPIESDGWVLVYERIQGPTN